MHRIQEALQQSPRKSTRRASQELTIPHVTVWHVLRRRLLMKPYRLQLVQALRVGDRRKRTDFCDTLLENTEDDTFLPRLIFSDEAMFHLSGKVSATMFAYGNLRIHKKLYSMSVIHRKINVFSVVSVRKMYGPFFFEGNTIAGNSYLEMLQDWLFPQLNEDSENFILQQDGALPHWHNQVHRFLNYTLPQHWIGCMGPKDLALHSWPPISPDMTPCDFFLWGYVEERVYVPPLTVDLDELTNRIMAVVKSVTEDTFRRVWDKFSYRVDVVRAAGGGHIEHL